MTYFLILLVNDISSLFANAHFIPNAKSVLSIYFARYPVFKCFIKSGIPPTSNPTTKVPQA